jgi:spoIIIJ-associated protein
VSTFTQKLLGLFKKQEQPQPASSTVSQAIVRPDNMSEIAVFAQTSLTQILQLANMPGKVSVYEDTTEMLSLEIENTPDTGRVIGKNGVTLEAFQILLKAFIQRKFGQRISLVIDANNYRKRYEEKLEQTAKKLAQRVLADQKTYRMRPMPAQDRRSIHRLFEHDSHIKSHSTGQGEYRYISLSPRNS